ncbi:sorting nexin-24-like [Haliotis rufescens]|uniref:sorting nexin-24-like n=1 Tax=Haliotis rufescens TaxID=6454 RepID=UPI001EB0307D|nr:sorting nexin-24-like [Haliotis rufescens]
MFIRASVPSFRKIKDEHENTFTVFFLEVWVSGRLHTVEKRYTEFEELHKQLKKVMRTPEFPPKKVLKWNSKVLEQRRSGLQSYLQGTLDGDILPKSLLKFLGISNLSDSIDSLDKLSQDIRVSHQPVISFPADSFLQENTTSTLPDIVAEGVTRGLYSPGDAGCPR